MKVYLVLKKSINKAMAQKILDIMNELQENESFRYVVDTLHLFFNIPQQSDSTNLEEKLLTLQNKFEEIASANQQSVTEGILKELVALKERLECQDQSQQELREESNSAIESIKEGIEKLRRENNTALKEGFEKIQQENTTALKEEVEKLQHNHSSLRVESENSITSIKEEIEKLQQDNTSLKEEIGKIRQESETSLDEESMEQKVPETANLSEDCPLYTRMKEEIEMLSSETTRLGQDVMQLRSNKDSQENLIDTLAQERQDQLEHIKQQTDLLSELRSTDEHHQSQLDDLRSMLEDQSLSLQQGSQEEEEQDATQSVKRSGGVDEERLSSERGSKISDIHYHLIRYSVENGDVIWKTEEVSVQSDGCWPDLSTSGAS